MKTFGNVHKCQVTTGSESFLPYLRPNATIFENIKRTVRKMMLISTRHAIHSNYFRSNASINAERRKQVENAYWLIIHPFSEFRLYWESLMVFVYILSLLITPIEVANHFIRRLNENNFTNFGIIMFIMHSFFLLDIYLTFITGYCDKSSKTVVMDPTKIVKKYLRSYLVWDILSTVPALMFSYAVYVNGIKLNYPRWTVCSLFKLVRVSTYTTYEERLCERLGLNDLVYRVVRFIGRSLVFFHWGALCVFIVPFVVSDVTITSNNAWFHFIKGDITQVSIGELYLRCLFHVISITLACAVADRAPTFIDFFTSIFFFILGILYCGYLFVELLDVVRSKFEPETKYDEFMTQLQEYMRHKQLPMHVQERLFSFYEFRYRHAYFKEGAIMSTLSARLRHEINSHGCRRMINTVDLFTNLSEDDIQDLVEHLKLQVYLPKDLILKAGSIGNSMYFISCGTVAVYTLSGKEVCHLYDGSYFGEIALIMKDRKRSASVHAVEICEVYVLDRNTFNRRLRSNARVYDILFTLCQKRMKETKAIEALHKKSFEYQDYADEEGYEESVV